MTDLVVQTLAAALNPPRNGSALVAGMRTYAARHNVTLLTVAENPYFGLSRPGTPWAWNPSAVAVTTVTAPNPSPAPTPEPSASPVPTALATEDPTAAPSPLPSAAPSPLPSSPPSATPSATARPSVTFDPTRAPTPAPTPGRSLCGGRANISCGEWRPRETNGGHFNALGLPAGDVFYTTVVSSPRTVRIAVCPLLSDENDDDNDSGSSGHGGGNGTSAAGNSSSVVRRRRKLLANGTWVALAQNETSGGGNSTEAVGNGTSSAANGTSGANATMSETTLAPSVAPTLAPTPAPHEKRWSFTPFLWVYDGCPVPDGASANAHADSGGGMGIDGGGISGGANQSANVANLLKTSAMTTPAEVAAMNATLQFWLGGTPSPTHSPTQQPSSDPTHLPTVSKPAPKPLAKKMCGGGSPAGF